MTMMMRTGTRLGSGEGLVVIACVQPFSYRNGRAMYLRFFEEIKKKKNEE